MSQRRPAPAPGRGWGGLFLSSLRSAEDPAKGGWWTVFTSPGQLSFDNYSALLRNAGISQAFWNTVLISVPTIVLVVVLAALAGRAFAWLDFPGRDAVFLVVVALRVVPVAVFLPFQMHLERGVMAVSVK